MEAYVIGGEISESKKYLISLKKEKINDKNYNSLLTYFDLVIRIIDDRNYKPDMNTFSEFIKKNNVNLKTWSFDLFNTWIETSKLDKSQREKLLELNKIYQN